MYYYFIGRIKSLTQDASNQNQCSFNVETSIKIYDKLIGIAFAADEVNFIKVPNELSVDDREIFSFLSLHSREKFKIKLELQDDNTKQNDAEKGDGQAEQNNKNIEKKRYVVTGATLLNE